MKRLLTPQLEYSTHIYTKKKEKNRNSKWVNRIRFMQHVSQPYKPTQQHNVVKYPPDAISVFTFLYLQIKQT